MNILLQTDEFSEWITGLKDGKARNIFLPAYAALLLTILETAAR